MKNNMDQLLQQALSPKEEPDMRLNEKIMQTAKETRTMRKKVRRFPAGVVAAALTLLIGSLGVFAGWKYLAPDQVADEVFEDSLLSEAFQTEDAIIVNETRETAGFKITLLGLVSGEGLSRYSEFNENGELEDDKTYAVVAIENADGTPRPKVSDEAYGQEEFYVSPYIKGMNMMDFNASTMGGGYSESVVDGIQYRILECDNVEIFAHKGLYIGVSDGFAPCLAAFTVNEATGEITENASYEGVSAVFNLPIPAFKGNEEAAEAYIKSMHEPEETDHSMDEEETDVQRIFELTKDWTLADFEANAECVVTKELTPDKDGYISYSYELEEGGGSDATVLSSEYFQDEMTGFVINCIYGADPMHIETLEKHEDGTMTLRVYEYAEQ